MRKIKHVVATGLIGWFLKKRGFYAWTSLWNTIYYKDKVPEPSSRLRKHEMMHIRQMEQDGKLWFMVKYAWFSIKYGYHNNPYEIEARKISE